MPKNQPRVAIIVVNYNTQELLCKCLEHIYKTTGLVVQTIVVDNGSKDDSVKLVKEKFPKAKLIVNTTNRGLTYAYNQAYNLVKEQYILLLNTDAFLKQDTLKELVEFLELTPAAGAVSPKLLNTDGTTQGVAFHIPSLGRVIQEYCLGESGRAAKYIPDADTPTRVEAVVDACLLIRSSVFEQMGKANEKLFLYFNDLDMCERIHRLGFDVWYHPKVKVTHLLGKSGNSTQPTPQYLKDTLLWPLRNVFKPRPQSFSQRLFLEDSITYFGWPKHLLITIIIWLSKKLNLS